MVAVLLAGGACADDAPSLTTIGDSEGETDHGTSTTDTPTTVNPDSTGVGTMGMDSGDTTRGDTEGTTTDTPTTDSPTTTDGGPVCGNGMIEAGEDCESEDLGGEDCASQGFTGGTLLCNADCTFDTSMCTSRTCGNDTIDGTEDCDGADLGGETCATQGFDGGNLACAADCTLDTSGCTNAPACGNDTTEMGEICDGTDLGGADCVSQGFTGGVLACAGDCTAYDTSGCTGGGACAHDICVTGGALDPACDPCVTQVCAADAFCCSDSWDNICVGEVTSVCGIMCGGGGVCGNDVIEAPEVCDGVDLGGEDCVSQGFAGGGVLACAGDCGGYDTSGCMAGAGGDCCAAHMGTGCDNAACEASVCAADAFCCDTQWDGICANEAIADAACVGAGGSCPGAGACGNGAIDAGEACDGANLNGQTCITQGFAGGVLACQAGCAAFNTAGCMGAAFPCSDQNIGNVTGAAVAMGNTAGDDGDLQPSCGGTGGNDHVMQWTATVAGNYTFDTFGSGYDSKLALYTDCATQLACNDDAGGGAQSQLVQNLAAGQTILIVVDGFNGATGNWVLNITAPAMAPVCGDGAITAPEVCDGANLNGQTCVTQGFAGGGVLACAAGCNSFNTAGCMGGGGACAHPLCSTGAALVNGCDPCVTQICAADNFCCTNSWDNICVGEVTSICGQMCGGGGGCAHPICTTGAALVNGCDPCVTQVCAADNFCCTNSWDNICVGEVTSICGQMCP